MFKLLCVLLLLQLFFKHTTSTIFAGGATFTNQFTQVAQAESKAVIIFDGKTEILLDSITFNINPISHDNFVWVIPVPAKPEVETIKDELSVKFEKLTEKKIDKRILWQKLLFFDITEENAKPSEVFTRPVDIWKFDIIEPGDYEKLNAAVREMGYFIPKEGRPTIREYIDKKWYFIVAHVNAMHIQMNASDSLTTPGAHTLPLKITFDTDKPIYPLKFASIPPDADSEYAGLGYEFGSSSENVLGEKDEYIDELLSEPSKNKFPSVPLRYMNLKVDLFVLADRKMTAENFVVNYAHWIPNDKLPFIDLNENVYVQLPAKSWYLTRLFYYQPLSQAKDVELYPSESNRSVNDYGSKWVQALKLLAIVCILFILLKRALTRNHEKRN
jgi:hypothetical protein